MTEKPILFSSEMIKAIQDGRKTQTRRVMKPQPVYDPKLSDNVLTIGGNGGGWVWEPGGQNQTQWFFWDDWSGFDLQIYLDGPYNTDRLWVRETWQAVSPDENFRPLDECNIIYRATDEHPGLFNEDKPEEPWYGWRPSIFMPRWASRITLKVLSVRVERLQDITPEDCYAEGAINPIIKSPIDPISEFYTLWDSINAKRGFSWASNPWVWVVEFEKI